MQSLSDGLAFLEQPLGSKIPAPSRADPESRNLFYIQDEQDSVLVVHLNKTTKGDLNIGESGSMGKKLKLGLGYNLQMREIAVYVVNSWASITDTERETIGFQSPELQSRVSCENELRVHSALAGTPHTLQLVATVDARGKSGEKKTYALFPFCEGGTLAARISEMNLSTQQKILIAIEVLTGLEAMHEKGIVHRDLTSNNIYFRQGKAQIADFGISVPLGAKLPDMLGTPLIRPPEFVKNKDSVCKAESDVYSLGCTFYQLLKGSPLITDFFNSQGKK